jgi:hypothetical protein
VNLTKNVHFYFFDGYCLNMFSPVVTRDPTAVEFEVQSAYLDMFPNGDKLFIPQIFGWAIDCFTGQYADYLPIDAQYHDFEHTLQGTLCMARILRGRHRAQAQPQLTQRAFELGIMAILMHDTGYLKHNWDTQGTGAKYTVIHVRRSAEFAAELLRHRAFAPAEIAGIQNMILCTGINAALDKIPFQSELEKIVGFALGTADLMGQMAADDYVEKLPVLFAEFAEAASFDGAKSASVGVFSSADDLMQKTPAFWEKFVRVKLERDFAGIYKFLNYPYPNGRNYYVDKIEANMARLRRQLAENARTSAAA